MNNDTTFRRLAVPAAFAIAFCAVLTASLPQPASALADEVPPVAVITPLPEQVSNGTWVSVDCADSEDSYGIITNQTWEIEHAGVVYYEYAEEFLFKFRELGLYTIKLTVTDGGNNSDVDFTAVYSILDADFDDLPDWWEEYFFHDLDEDDVGDPDGDGYTNLQEYAGGMDPEVHDAAAAGILEKYWMYFAAAALAAVAAVLLMRPKWKRRRKQDEDAKIQAALDIEKALETED